jgi:hypothetical protein
MSTPVMSASVSATAVAPSPVSSAQPLSNVMLVEEPDLAMSVSLHGYKKPSDGVYSIPINKQKKIAWVESQVSIL